MVQVSINQWSKFRLTFEMISYIIVVEGIDELKKQRPPYFVKQTFQGL